jgi:citrate lyase subunit beta/citryl-CoA lyase
VRELPTHSFLTASPVRLDAFRTWETNRSGPDGPPAAVPRAPPSIAQSGDRSPRKRGDSDRFRGKHGGNHSDVTPLEAGPPDEGGRGGSANFRRIPTHSVVGTSRGCAMNPLRSMIFTPGHRRDLIEKAIRSGADAVIVDLEDAVAVENKVEARESLADLPSSHVPLYVRVNGPTTEFMWEDVVAAARAGVAGIVLPKAEEPGLLKEISGALTAIEISSGYERGAIGIIPLIESGLGVRQTYEMLVSSDRIESVLFGGGEQGDLVADLGSEWTPDGTGLMLARSQVLLSARAAGIQHPMEAVFMDFRNLDALRVECELARRLGYVGKVAIHPAQVAVINDVFTPAPDVVAYQRKVLAAFEEAEANGSASIAVDGKMVDYAVARVARVIIARAEAAERAGAREQK